MYRHSIKNSALRTQNSPNNTDTHDIFVPSEIFSLCPSLKKTKKYFFSRYFTIHVLLSPQPWIDCFSFTANVMCFDVTLPPFVYSISYEYNYYMNIRWIMCMVVKRKSNVCYMWIRVDFVKWLWKRAGF